MKVIINNNKIFFTIDNKNQLKIIKKSFTYKDYSLVFMGGTYNKNMIKNICFVKKTKDKDLYYLNSGFLVKFLKVIKNNDFKIDLKDNRIKLETIPSREEIKTSLNEFDLFDYQIDSVEKMFKNINGILKLPTSAGKSEIMKSFIKLSKLKTIILFPDVTLTLQMYKRFQTDFPKEKLGLFYGGANIDGDIICSTNKSAYKIPNPDKFDCLISDEVHKSSAKTYLDFLKKYDFKFKYGLSATPDKRGEYPYALIHQNFGDIIYEIEPDILIEANRIAKPIFHIIRNKAKPTLNWNIAEDKFIIKNEKRNNIIKKIVKLNKDKQILIIISKIEHGEILNNLIPNSFFVYGGSSSKEREEIIEKFENKELNILIASGIFNQGINIKNVEILINAAGMKSKVLTIQKLGRGLRVTDEKTELNYYDFYDEGNKYLLKHSKERIKEYKNLFGNKAITKENYYELE